MSNPTILVVDDDKSMREALSDTLQLEGYDVKAVSTAQDALAALYGDLSIDLMLSDVQMDPMDGLSLLRSVRQAGLDVPVLLMTAFASVEQAIQAIRLGAVDYLSKPFDAKQLLEKVANATHQRRQGNGLIYGDPIMSEVVALARRVAKSEATVMISGESGSGKEVMAQYIHSQSLRADKPFIAINCAAIPENMLEAVLFGYEKGAYTGAYKTTPGKFEQAQGGTLLLDEISEMDISLQAKLLRVLQEKEVERLGGKGTIELDVRILATTNRNLRKEVAEGQFREDLFYRLNVFPMRLPALRARPGDIQPIAEVLLGKHTPKGVMPKKFSEDAIHRLLEHSWPGNVRELENVVQRALILSDHEMISPLDIQFEFSEDESPTDESVGRLEGDLKSRESEMILEALRAHNGSRKAASELLGISPRTLRYKLSRMRDRGIDIPEVGQVSAA